MPFEYPFASPKHTSGKGRTFHPLWLIILAMLMAAFILFFVVNRWTVKLTLKGDAALTLEYGQSYDEQGAQAILYGSLFLKDGWQTRVKTIGKVDCTRLGTYRVIYRARCFGTLAQAVRQVTIRDTQPPQIRLTANADSYTLPGEEYQEEGYAAEDNYDGDLTEQVRRKVKNGKVYYTVADSSGNETTVMRRINYNDPLPPEITLTGGTTLTISAGDTYIDPGWTAMDNCDGDVTSLVQVNGTVDTYQVGEQVLEYSVSDNYGNIATVRRTVVVEPIRQSDNVQPGEKNIYLTFDDGPSPYTQQLLDTLEQYNVKATFFTVNTPYASLIAEEAAGGHTVGIHSASHKYSKIYDSQKAFFKDFYKQRTVIYEKTGVYPTILRFPGGSSNTMSKRYCKGIMTKLTKAVTKAGFQYYDWNVLSGDAGETTSTEQVFQNVIDGVQKYNDSVVLQHDTMEFSVNAVERIIIWGLAHGYTFLPLTEDSPVVHHKVCN